MTKKNIFALLALTAVVFCLSLPSLHYGYLLDDYKNIRSYPLAEIAATFYSHWEPMRVETRGYRPLHSVHQALFYQVLGSDPLRHRLLQMLLSISGVLLMYAFILRCSGTRSAAFWPALVYPCLGTSAWMISFLCSRQHIVQLNLILLTLIFFDRYLTDRRGRNWSIAFISFLLAFLLKEEVTTLPLILAAYGILVKGETIRRLLRPLWPFLLLTAFLLLMRAMIAHTFPAEHEFPPPLRADPGYLFKAYGHSLISTLVQTYGSHDPGNWPFPIYGGGLSITRDYLGLISLLVFFLLSAGSFARRGSVPAKKAFAFGLLVLLIGSVLVSAWYRNDRLYISSIGVSLMVGTLVSFLFQDLAGDTRKLLDRSVTIGALICFFVYLGVNLIAYYDLQAALHPYGPRALLWDKWVYEENWLPRMKEEQIDLYKSKLRRTGRGELADHISALGWGTPDLPTRGNHGHALKARELE